MSCSAVGLAPAPGQPDDASRSAAMLLVNVFGLLTAEVLAFTVAKHLPWLWRSRSNTEPAGREGSA